MNPFEPKNLKEGPEAKIQRDIENALKILDWVVKSTHGSAYQSGFPDIWAAHSKWGQRWIEVKQPTGYSFTPAQLEFFPKMTSAGVGVWILTGADSSQLQRLSGPPNWFQYYMQWSRGS